MADGLRSDESSRLLSHFGLYLGDNIQCASLIALLIRMGESEEDAVNTALELTMAGPLPVSAWIDMVRKRSQSPDPAMREKWTILTEHEEESKEEGEAQQEDQEEQLTDITDTFKGTLTK